MRMRIRPARKTDDFQAIAQLYLTTWRATYAGLFDQTFLDGLTTAVWHPDQQWRRMFLAETDAGDSWVFARMGLREHLSWLTGARCMPFIFCRHTSTGDWDRGC